MYLVKNGAFSYLLRETLKEVLTLFYHVLPNLKHNQVLAEFQTLNNKTWTRFTRTCQRSDFREAIKFLEQV